jgi:WD40 repeat protein
MQNILSLGETGLVVSCGADASITLWDTERLSPSTFGLASRATTPHAPINVHSSPDGALVATCSANRHVCVWDSETLEPVRTMAAMPGSRVKDAAFSGDCNLMAVVLFDSTITVWDVTREELVWQPQARGARDALKEHAGGVNGCALSQVCSVTEAITECMRVRLMLVHCCRFAAPCQGEMEVRSCGHEHPCN